jgi:drug/metabolite transporter (DMT)-like permease
VHRATTVRLALLAVVWGSNFLWIKLAIRGLSPVEVTLTRLVLGSGVLFAIVLTQRGSMPRSHAVRECLTAAASYGMSYVYMDRFLARRGISPATLFGLPVVSSVRSSRFGAGRCGRAGAAS